MNILMPQLGETVAEGKITKWFKSAGDAVKPGDNLFEIETDKVSMEVPAIEAGILSGDPSARRRSRAGRGHCWRNQRRYRGCGKRISEACSGSRGSTQGASGRSRAASIGVAA